MTVPINSMPLVPYASAKEIHRVAAIILIFATCKTHDRDRLAGKINDGKGAALDFFCRFYLTTTPGEPTI